MPDPRTTSISRRRLLAGGSAALACGMAGPVEAAPHARRRVDVHHHLAPPSQIAALDKAGAPLPALMRSWTVEASLAAMNDAAIDEEILSITSPGLWFTDDREIGLAREANDDAWQLVRAHPGRFGFFAALPLSHIDASIAEADRALDQLGARGVLLFTNVQGRYLGDPSFAPLLDHLDARGTVAFVHPIGNACCQTIVPGIPETVVEYAAETARTIASLIFSPRFAERRRLRFLFCHGGGAIGSITERLRLLAGQRRLPDPDRFIGEALAGFFYDTAQAGNRLNLATISAVAAPGHVLFGSDYPFPGVRSHTDALGKLGFVVPDDASLFGSVAAPSPGAIGSRGRAILR